MSASPLLHEARRAVTAGSRKRVEREAKPERKAERGTSKSSSVPFVIGLVVWGALCLGLTYAVLVLSMNTHTAGLKKDLSIAKARAGNIELELGTIRNRLERLAIPTEVIRWADSKGMVIAHQGVPADQEEGIEQIAE